VAQPVALAGHEYTLTASIGFAVFPQDGADAETLLRNADEAMYRAKELGRNNFQAYSADLHARFTERLALHNGLRRALENDEFLVYYQPQADLCSGRIVAVEALVRWKHPEQGLVSPDRFIPAAEETGLIAPIGEYVLRTACAQARAWQAAGMPLRVAVNLSPRQFWQPQLSLVVEDALRESGLDPIWLELELTESLIVRSVEEAVRTMHALRRMGIGLAIDDFGTGYSSLSSLKRFPINRLKIAQQFLREIPADADSVAIAQAVIALGHNMRLSVIAEGVESAAQLAFLRENGCDEIQGYLLSRPVPAEEVPALLRAPQAVPIGV
jgi:EAL domain-containing protein (putative c-di-GMP-specific phosphodiesterase class I)